MKSAARSRRQSLDDGVHGVAEKSLPPPPVKAVALYKVGGQRGHGPEGLDGYD